jgi:hypothetical protein
MRGKRSGQIRSGWNRAAPGVAAQGYRAPRGLNNCNLRLAGHSQKSPHGDHTRFAGPDLEKPTVPQAAHAEASTRCVGAGSAQAHSGGVDRRITVPSLTVVQLLFFWKAGSSNGGICSSAAWRRRDASLQKLDRVGRCDASDCGSRIPVSASSCSIDLRADAAAMAVTLADASGLANRPPLLQQPDDPAPRAFPRRGQAPEPLPGQGLPTPGPCRLRCVPRLAPRAAPPIWGSTGGARRTASGAARPGADRTPASGYPTGVVSGWSGGCALAA